jgi:hypothetical protein
LRGTTIQLSESSEEAENQEHAADRASGVEAD